MQDRKPIELENGWSFMQVCSTLAIVFSLKG
jgi:hypothetical protein